MSRFTRTTPAATAGQLMASAADLRAEIDGLEAEERDANAALPDLIGDPSYGNVEARVRELRFVIPSKKDVLARIESAIPAAQERERRASFADKRTDLERRTAKLSRNLERRYRDAASALAGVLEDMLASEREWEALGHEGRDLGEQGIGYCAEYRARGDLPGARMLGVYQSVIRDARIPNWQGGPLLFDGDPRPRP